MILSEMAQHSFYKLKKMNFMFDKVQSFPTFYFKPKPIFMKKCNVFLISNCFLIVLSLLSSCNDMDLENDDYDVNTHDVFQNSIGILGTDGSFKRLDRIDMNNFIKSDLDLEFSNKNIEFHDYSIQEAQDENRDAIYFLKTTSTDKSASVSIKLLRDPNGNLLLTGDTCKCESTDCSFGCNASGAGPTCSCSICNNECKKTSTSGEDKSLAP